MSNELSILVLDYSKNKIPYLTFYTFLFFESFNYIVLLVLQDL